VLLESSSKVVQVGVADVLDREVVNNEGKHDGAPLVSPETWSGGCFKVVKFGKAFTEEVVCKDTGLGEAVHAASHFEVDPAVADKFFESVFLDEFFGDVGDFDADIFWSVQGGVEVEILEIEGCKASLALGEYTVDEELDKFERACGGANVSGVRYVVAANGDASSVGGVAFLGLDFADDLGVGDFLSALKRNFVVSDGEEGVGAFYALAVVGTSVDALAEAAKLI
jgi:hypothetical protein